MKARKIIVCCLLFSVIGWAQETRKVLFLGNSYTYVNNLPQTLSALATSAGDILLYDANLVGGYTLMDHYTSDVSRNKILSNSWDYIVLQEQSQRPAFPVPSAFMDGFFFLKDYIKQNQSCAQLTSFMTWGHKNGDVQNCAINPMVCSYDGMQNLLQQRYLEMSDLNQSEVTPVGVVWRYIKENYPDINLYHPDDSHPTVAGTYLAACCFYTSLFRKDPMLITDNYGLDAPTAEIIRSATKSLVFEHMADWYIGRYVPTSGFTHVIGEGFNQVRIFSFDASFYSSLLWDFGDGTTSTELVPTHSYANDGTYTIKQIVNKCYLGQNLESVTEQTVTFCPHTNTIFPNLLLCPETSGTVWTQPAESYQWLNDYGQPIPGATQQSLEVWAGYSYSVLTTVNGCTERSPQILVDSLAGGIGNPDDCTLGTGEIKKPEVLVWPNPAQNNITIETEHKIEQITIWNSLGQKVKATDDAEKIDISTLDTGIYLVVITGNSNKVLVSKFIKS